MTRCTLFGFALLMLINANTVLADAAKSPHAEIEARYRQMNKAYMTKDIQSLESLFAPKCKIKQQSEPLIINAKQFILATKGLLVTTQVKSSKTKIEQLKSGPNQVVVKVIWSAVSWLTKDPRTFKSIPPKPRSTQQTIQDTWVKSGKKWLIQSRLVLG